MMTMRGGWRYTPRLLARTSRREGAAHGSWSHPHITDDREALAAAFRTHGGGGAGGRAPSAGVGSSQTAGGGGGASPAVPTDAADNAALYGMQENPYHNNWKATAPQAGHFSYADFRQHLEVERKRKGVGRSGLKEGEGEFRSHHSTVHDTTTSWRGKSNSTNLQGLPKHASGSAADAAAAAAAEQDSTAALFHKKRPKTITEFCKSLFDASFEPREADSKAFGGDGATERASQMEDLKRLDSRIAPIFHENLMNDTLRNLRSLITPSGAICTAGREELLKGRLVGLLFFSESERSMAFMRLLKAFCAVHSPDFVVVAMSLAGQEMSEVSRGHGFYHATHRGGGATWVKRDAGLEMKLLVPLPRLLIVDGTTGVVISRSGVTEVVSRSETCMKAWREGYSDCTMWDYIKTWYLSDGV